MQHGRIDDKRKDEINAQKDAKKCPPGKKIYGTEDLNTLMLIQLINYNQKSREP